MATKLQLSIIVLLFGFLSSATSSFATCQVQVTLNKEKGCKNFEQLNKEKFLDYFYKDDDLNFFYLNDNSVVTPVRVELCLTYYLKSVVNAKGIQEVSWAYYKVWVGDAGMPIVVGDTIPNSNGDPSLSMDNIKVGWPVPNLPILTAEKGQDLLPSPDNYKQLFSSLRTEILNRNLCEEEEDMAPMSLPEPEQKQQEKQELRTLPGVDPRGLYPAKGDTTVPKTPGQP